MYAVPIDGEDNEAVNGNNGDFAFVSNAYATIGEGKGALKIWRRDNGTYTRSDVESRRDPYDVLQRNVPDTYSHLDTNHAHSVEADASKYNSLCREGSVRAAAGYSTINDMLAGTEDTVGYAKVGPAGLYVSANGPGNTAYHILMDGELEEVNGFGAVPVIPQRQPSLRLCGYHGGGESHADEAGGVASFDL